MKPAPGRWHILADQNIPLATELFAPLGSVQTFSGRDLRSDDLQGVDVLLVRSVTRVDAALLQAARPRFVGTATSGVDHLDLDLLSRQGIPFARAPGSNARSVVEYVLSAIAVSGQRLEKLLQGGTVGVVGYGVIGRQLVAQLQALGVRCRVYDPWLEPGQIPGAATLYEVLGSDVVSLHCELTDRQPWPSRHLLDREALDRLRAEALLINASRGEVVDNRALLELLQGAGPSTVLDVWEGEPAISTELLEHVALGTAHIAGYSYDGKVRATRMLLDACCQALAVEKPVADPPLQRQTLSLASGRTGATLIRDLLAQVYDIREDDGLLREAAARGEIGAGFDRLRRTYRRRREVWGSRVEVAGPQPAQGQLLAALGCEAVEARE